MNEHDRPAVDDHLMPDQDPIDAIGGPTAADERPPGDEPRPGSTPVAWPRPITLIKIGIVAAVATVFLGVGAFAAASFYSEYGAVKNEPNARDWAGLTPQYAGQAACTSCHGREAGIQDASIHRDVSCEACHGPQAAHSSSEAAASKILPDKPNADICVTCHGLVAGRPATFPQIDQAEHYSGDQCVRCHDPHSIVAVRPPVVSHPLANLPECTTCHAPEGLRRIPTGHVLAEDPVCLSCHERPALDRS